METVPAKAMLDHTGEVSNLFKWIDWGNMKMLYHPEDRLYGKSGEISTPGSRHDQCHIATIPCRLVDAFDGDWGPSNARDRCGIPHDVSLRDVLGCAVLAAHSWIFPLARKTRQAVAQIPADNFTESQCGENQTEW